jgi:hypothetical protein
MKKIKIHYLAIVFIIGILNSQNFIYTPSETYSHIELGYYVAPTGTIQNISDDSLSLAIVRTDLDLPPDWENKLCFGGICFPADWDSLDTANPGAPFYQEPIPPDSVIYFSVWFTAISEFAGTATATIKMYDLNNPTMVHIQDYMASTEPFNVINNTSSWNLIGLPSMVEDVDYELVFPNGIPGTLYGYSDYYYQTQELIPGNGYWLRFDTGGNTVVFGNPYDELEISLNAEWNLITGISDTVELSQFEDENQIIIPETLFGFTDAYEQTTTLLPGKGYWLRTTEGGDITIALNTAMHNIKSFESCKSKANYLNISGQYLYFGISLPPHEKLSYSLPPKPPSGAFDVRFSDDQSIIYNDGIIEIMNSEKPLMVSYDVNKVIGNWILINPESDWEYRLSTSGEIKLPKYMKQLYLKNAIDPVKPNDIHFIKAYPNPFNPTTSIHFSLPEVESGDQFVSVVIFDITGRMIKEIVNGKLKQNNHDIQWNGTNNYNEKVSAGVYLVNIQSDNYSNTEKLILLK